MIRPIPWLLVLGVSMAAQGGFRLESGLSLEGQKKKGGIQTPFGWVTTEGEPATLDLAPLIALIEERLLDTPAEFVAGRAALARYAIDRGAWQKGRDLLADVLERDPDQPLARETVRQLAKSCRLDESEGGARSRDHSRLSKVIFEEWAPKGPLEAAIGLEKTAHLPEERAFRDGLDGLKSAQASVRWMSAQILAKDRHRPERINPLYKRALLDPASAVRTESVRALRKTEDPAFVGLFAKNLRHPRAEVRAHAAEALGELGYPEAVPPLIEALTDAWRPTRNFIQVTTQRAYVKDFDVEVAASAMIADPIVDIVQEGAVLDVAIIQVDIERTIISQALRRLTGRDLGTDPARWRTFRKTS